MGNINRIVLEGNLTAAATLSHWPNGKAYAKFTIAHSKSYKDQNGQWQEIVSFIDCQIRGAYAEAMTKNLLKGRHITVDGEIKQDRWTDDQQQKHSTVYINVDKISLAPGGFTQKSETPDAGPVAGPEPTENFDDLDAGIPF